MHFTEMDIHIYETNKYVYYNLNYRGRRAVLNWELVLGIIAMHTFKTEKFCRIRK